MDSIEVVDEREVYQRVSIEEGSAEEDGVQAGDAKESRVGCIMIANLNPHVQN